MSEPAKIFERSGCKIAQILGMLQRRMRQPHVFMVFSHNMPMGMERERTDVSEPV